MHPTTRGAKEIETETSGKGAKEKTRGGQNLPRGPEEKGREERITKEKRRGKNVAPKRAGKKSIRGISTKNEATAKG